MKRNLKYAELCQTAYEDHLTSVCHDTKFIECKATDTQLYILSNKHEQIVVFRGTEATGANESTLKDIKTDLKIGLRNGMHQGFKEAYDSIAEELNKHLKYHTPVMFTGHSLGGALAIIACSMSTHPRKSCITFGAPRVFNDTQAGIYDEFLGDNTLRYENEYDPVPYLPPYSMGYRHVGVCVKLNGEDQILNPSEIFSGLKMFFASTSKKIKAHSIETYIKNLTN